MCDTTDSYTASAALCTDGTTPGGWACTGHAHLDGEHIRCTDLSHQSPGLLLDGKPLGTLIVPPAVLPEPGESMLAAAIRQSWQAETLGVTR